MKRGDGPFVLASFILFAGSISSFFEGFRSARNRWLSSRDLHSAGALPGWCCVVVFFGCLLARLVYDLDDEKASP